MEYQFKEHKLHVILDDTSIVLRRGKNDLMIHKSLRGDTKLFLNQITEIKFKEPTMMSKGYNQFSTPRTSFVGAIRTIDQPQNAITFKKDELEKVLEIKSFVESKINGQ